MMAVELWCDGSGTTQGKPGGWAFLLRSPDGREREGVGYVTETTSQRMELTAALEGLRALSKPCRVSVFSDSQYVVMGFAAGRVERWRRNGWRTSAKRPVANRDLWELLHAAAEAHDVTWSHVPGHAGVELNERVDKLAGRARQVALGNAPALGLLTEEAAA